MLPAPADKHGLLGSERAIEAQVETVCVAGRRGLLEVVGLRAETGAADIDVGRGEIVVEQTGGDRIDAILRIGALGAAGDLIIGIRLAGEGVHQHERSAIGILQPIEITLTHGVGGNKEKERRGKSATIGFDVGEEESFCLAVWKLGKQKGATEAATEGVVGLVGFVAGVPHFGVEGVVLQIFESATVKLIAAAFGGDGDISELGEFCVVVELRDFEFADEFGRRVHVAEGAVLTDVHGRRAVDRILDLRRKPATDRDIAVGVLLRARNGRKHRKRARGGATIIYRETGDLLEILAVADGAVFRVDHGTGFAADFDALCRGSEVEGDIEAKALASVELEGRNLVVSKAICVNHQFVASGFQVDEFKSPIPI